MDTQRPTPKHIAIICDGNRRWARGKGLAAFMGHNHAVNNTIEELINTGLEVGLEYMTFWIFSTENWNREPAEIEWLMNLFRKMFDEKIEQYHQKGVRVKHIGNKAGLAADIQEKIDQGIEKTKDNTKMTVVVAMNYGGRDEIVRATKKMCQAVADGELALHDITEQTFVQHLDTADFPDPEMIVRTSGEHRLSGFLSWQQQYSEFFFPKFDFPDFTGERLKELIAEFHTRDRRFGGNSTKA